MYPGFPESFIQDQPINAGSAYVWGWEIAYQQRWSFLPGFLGGLGFSGNYAWTTSATFGLPGRSDHPPLLRQAPNNWNLGPTYARGKLTVTMGLTYNGASIYAYQLPGWCAAWAHWADGRQLFVLPSASGRAGQLSDAQRIQGYRLRRELNERGLRVLQRQPHLAGSARILQPNHRRGAALEFAGALTADLKTNFRFGGYASGMHFKTR